MSKTIKGISLFASAGIGELLIDNSKFEIVAANELLKKRADCYKHLYPNTEVFQGDINDQNIKNELKRVLTSEIEFLIATPPCQGLSSLGKNKGQEAFLSDPRNYLIFNVFEIIDNHNFNFILIENVPRFLKMYFPFENEFLLLEEIIKRKYGEKYNIDIDVLDAKDYEVPQTRPRAIIKIYKKNISWPSPEKSKVITLADVISHLPSLVPGESSHISNHSARLINNRVILALSHTPTGKSAHKNEVYYPKKENGDRIKGFHNTYKRMDWTKPSHARTTYSGSVSSHNNVHPGRLQPDGTYSDTRVLSILETLIVSSIPENTLFPPMASETFIREIIGEAIPPRMLFAILSTLNME
jgi:DNA (cytosine-5)-methyltransferase 1